MTYFHFICLFKKNVSSRLKLPTNADADTYPRISPWLAIVTKQKIKKKPKKNISTLPLPPTKHGMLSDTNIHLY